jgi:hypothetical protein
MVEPADNAKYELKATGLHSETASEGHYSSLVRRLNKWIKCNDMKGSEMFENRFNHTVFGKSEIIPNQHISPDTVDTIPDFDTGTCAYLLFYERIGATIAIDKEMLRYDTDIQFDSKMDQEIIDSLEHKNQEHFKLQALFVYEMRDFFIGVSNPKVLLKYCLFISFVIPDSIPLICL